MSHRVLVLDANQRSALAVTRSLGGHGLEVIAADSTSGTVAGASKFSSRSAHYPDPAVSPAAFLQAVDELTSSLHVDVVVPITDITTMLLAGSRQAGNAKLACASQTSYEALSDKAKLVQLAQNLGIPVPQTYVIRSIAEGLKAHKDLPFPVVLKPSRSRYLHNGCIHSTQVHIASSAQELRKIIDASEWLEHIPGLFQEFIPGHGAGAFALGNGSDCVAWFAHRRIREKPPSGGVSVLCESVAIDPAIKLIAERLLKSVAWFGPAMIEFRVAADGTPYLMEVNGRFWGSLQLSIDSGIDFPWLLYGLMFDNAPTQRQEYQIGKRLRWLLGDVDNLLIQVRTHGVDRSKVLRDFFSSFLDASVCQETFRWSDPKPAWRELNSWLKALA